MGHFDMAALAYLRLQVRTLVQDWAGRVAACLLVFCLVQACAARGAVEGSERGRIEAGVPDFTVLGAESLGLSAPPRDIHELPDGRILAVGRRELAMGDGVRWDSYQQEEGEAQVDIGSVAYDGEGRLYAGVPGGFAEIEFTEQAHWRFKPVAGLPAGMQAPAVLLNFCSMAGGEWTWYGGSGPVVSWKPGEPARLLGRTNAPERVFLLEGRLHLSDNSTGALLEREGGVFNTRISAEQTYVDRTITCTVAYAGGGSLVGTLGRGVQLWRGGEAREFFQSLLLSGQHRINDLCQAGEGLYAAAVDNVGIVFFDQEGRVIQVLDRTQDHRLASLRRLLVSRGGRLWGLLNEGLLKVDFPAQVSRFEPYVGTGLVYAQPCRFEGKLWLMSDGRAQRGVYDENGRLVRFEVDSPEPYLCSLMEVGGRLVAGSRGGLFQRDGEGNWLQIDRGPVSAHLRPEPVTPGCWLYVAHDEVGWVRLTEGRFTVERFSQPGMGEAFNAVADAAGRYWVELGNTRVARVEPTMPRPRIEVYGAAEGVADGWVQAFVVNGEARINVQDQILRLDEGRGRWVQDTDLLSSIPQLRGASGRPVQDQAGRLWVTGKEGVLVLERKDGRFVRTGVTLPIDLRPLYFTPDENGVMWMHERMKLARFDPRIPAPARRELRVLVTQVQLPQSGRTLVPREGRLPDLPPSDQALIVHLQAPASPLGKPVHFEVLMEGLGKKWVPTGGLGIASFNRLGPGAYTLRVRAWCGTESSEETTLGFSILAPWYRTPWAYLGYVLLAGLGAGLVWYLQRREKTRLSSMVAQRTRELNQSNEELNRALQDSLEKTEALRVSEDRYRRLSENAPDIIFRIRLLPEPGYDFISPVVTLITGYEPEAFYRNVRLIAEIAQPAGARTILDQLAVGKIEEGVRELVWRTKTGELRHIEERLVPVRDGAGRLVAVEGIDRDITQRKKNEGVINTLSQAVDQSPSGVFITDLDGLVIFSNPKMSQLCGYEREELKGRNLHQLDSHLVQPELVGDLWPTLGAGRAWFGEFGLRRKDGRVIHLRMSFNPLRDAEGRVANYLALSEDISQWIEDQERKRRLESQLFQSQKLESLGTLAGGIAHDFNNILTGILGYCELADANFREGRSPSEELMEVRKAGLRAKDLVSRILAFSRQNESKPVLLELSRTVDEALRLVRASTPSTIEISRDLESGLVNADPTQVHQIVLNLCTNAVHAMGDKSGVLGVRVHAVKVTEAVTREIPGAEEGPYLCLSIADTGHGMDEATQSRIFDPFFTTKKQGEGTGLGLAIVQGIVAKHKALMTVRSKPGKGTVFDLYFPRVEGVEPRENKPVSMLKGDRQEILVVDDEPLVAGFIATSLRRANYVVTACNDPREAVVEFRKESMKYAAVVTDLTMPHLTGVDLIEELRVTRPGLPAVIVSGYSKELTRQAAAALPLTITLGKPFGSQELARALAEILGKASQAT